MAKNDNPNDVSSWAPSRKWGARTIFAALTAIKEAGGSLDVGSILEAVEKVTSPDEWAKHVYEKTGYIRWQSLLYFFSIDSVKSGFLIKKKGVWYLTPEGENELKNGQAAFFNAANEGYKKWRLQNPKSTQEDLLGLSDNEVDSTPTPIDTTALEQAELRSRESIRKFIFTKGAYEFQDLCAALLRAMGYFTPFIAPKGKDGGVDVMAYRDPLGAQTPRIKVQIKHREDKSASVKEVRELLGLLSKDGDTGLLISTGGFSPDALTATRQASSHIELIDLDRFIDLWQQFFQKLPDEDQSMLPLVPVYYLNQSL
jgi:restriction system protein